MEDRDLRNALIDEASRLSVDVLYSEKCHFSAASPWRWAHILMGVPSAILAALAAASFMAEWFAPWVAPMLATASAIITALITFLKPDNLAEQHHSAGVKYGDLRRKLRQFANIKAHLAEHTLSELEAELALMTERVNSIQSDARPIPKQAYANAYKSIKNGSAEYTKPEIEQALGKPV